MPVYGQTDLISWRSKQKKDKSPKKNREWQQQMAFRLKFNLPQVSSSTLLIYQASSQVKQLLNMNFPLNTNTDRDGKEERDFCVAISSQF